MSKAFSEWAAKRNKCIESTIDEKKEATVEETQAIAVSAISSNTFMIAYELDRLCDILERKGR